MSSRREILQLLATKRYDRTQHPLRIPPKQTSLLDFDIPPLSFSGATEDFRSRLVHNGIPLHMCQAALRRASEIAAVYEQSYANSCQHLMASSSDDPSIVMETIDNLRRTFEHLYEHKDLVNFVSTAVTTHALYSNKVKEYNAACNGRERRPFNQEFTPILEVYFQQNAFPSAADQKSLAEKGKMSRRQIEVWFQNHRNRAKKDGQTLKRLAHCATVNISLDFFTASTSSFTGNTSAGDNMIGDSSSDDEDTNNEDELQTPQSTALNPSNLPPRDEIPKYCVPRPIQSCTTDCKTFGLPHPSWTRSTTASQTRPSTSMSELIEMFSAKLNLREGASRKTSKRSQSPVLESWVSATTTVPCPAPHPAMIRRLSRFFTGMSSPRPRIPPQTFVPIKVPSLPSVLPTWELSPPPRRRKPAQLPRRSPPYARPCESQSAPQHSTLSRASSISSISSVSSSDSRSTSSSTSTSSTSTSEFTAESSPELTTPPASPTPDGTQTFDADQDDDIFGDRYYESYSRTQDVYDEQAFNKDVSQSMPQFEAMSLPEFHYFDS